MPGISALPAVRELGEARWDEDFLFVESNGIPDHQMMVGIIAWQQQVPRRSRTRAPMPGESRFIPRWQRTRFRRIPTSSGGQSRWRSTASRCSTRSRTTGTRTRCLLVNSTNGAATTAGPMGLRTPGPGYEHRGWHRNCEHPTESALPLFERQALDHREAMMRHQRKPTIETLEGRSFMSLVAPHLGHEKAKAHPEHARRDAVHTGRFGEHARKHVPANAGTPVSLESGTSSANSSTALPPTGPSPIPVTGSGSAPLRRSSRVLHRHRRRRRQSQLRPWPLALRPIRRSTCLAKQSP